MDLRCTHFIAADTYTKKEEKKKEDEEKSFAIILLRLTLRVDMVLKESGFLLAAMGLNFF